MSYLYLASPYSHEDKKIEDLRYEAVLENTVLGMLEGSHIFSPIVHCHVMARQYELPGDINFWKEYDEAMIRKSSAFLILMLPGWDTSKGIAHERKFAKQRNLTEHLIVPRGKYVKELEELAASVS